MAEARGQFIAGQFILVGNNLLDNGAWVINSLSLWQIVSQLIQTQAIITFLSQNLKSVCLCAYELVAILLFDGVPQVTKQLCHFAAIDGGEMETGQRRRRVVVLGNFEA